MLAIGRNRRRAHDATRQEAHSGTDHWQASRSGLAISKGRTTEEAAKAIGVTVQTYFRWRKEYGGLRTDQAKRLKSLEKKAPPENLWVRLRAHDGKLFCDSHLAIIWAIFF